ncbi:MAG: biopolymer transporter ExbD [Bacteroidetes bacterium]|nr:biopolymer transporter ExbD [Bacteroidota bacterium]
MADLSQMLNKGTKKSASGSNHRRSTRVDLTPMVDLGFLLITFFVFTSALSTPQTMSMIEPKDGTTKPTGASSAMTIIVGANHQLYYYYGMEEVEIKYGSIYPADFKNIRNLILDMKMKTAASKLMYIIKASDRASFGDAVNIIDEMTICGIKPGHFAEATISDQEMHFIDSHHIYK